MSSFRLRDLDDLPEEERVEKYKRVFDAVATRDAGRPTPMGYDSSALMLEPPSEVSQEIYSPFLPSITWTNSIR
jgi:hypothetical protein